MDTKEKMRPAAATKPRRPAQRQTPKEQRPLQDVVYMPPKPFVRNRLLLRLATIAAVVVALVLAMAVFFKVEHIQVSGMEQYTAWDISQASGIEQGDSLFSLELPAAAARVKALPYVKDVRVGIKLPNMVLIEIVEVRVTYAVKSQEDDWWLVDSTGRIVEQLPADSQKSHTKILGVHLLNPVAGTQAVAQETAVPEVDAEGNPIPLVVTAAQRLSVALRIADNLEACGILGEAASIDVNAMDNLQVWYGQQYQIKLGDASQLEHKISMVKGAIDRLSAESHNSGVLDASFTVDKTGIRYTRFQ